MKLRKRSKRLSGRLAAVCLGLLLTFLLIEGGLRVGGVWVRRSLKRRERHALRDQGPNSRRICCLGDSFTYGIGAPPEGSYPSWLETLLNERGDGKAYEVLNLGVPAQNTAMICGALDEQISRFRPDLILLLAGCNNSWNVTGRARDGSLPRRTCAMSAREYLRTFKTYTLTQVCFANCRNAFALWRIRARFGAPERSAEGAYRRAEYYRNEGRPEPAVPLFRQSLALDPTNTMVRCELARTLFDVRRDAEAVAELEEAIKRDPSSPLPYCMLAAVHATAPKGHAAALALLEKATAAAPRSSRPHQQLGELYFNLRRIDEAEREFALAIESDPSAADGYYALALVYCDRGQSELALAMVKRGVALDHDYTRAAKGLCFPAQDHARYVREIEALREECDLYCRRHPRSEEIRCDIVADGTVPQRQVNEWTSRDINTIVGIARTRGVEVVIVGYPKHRISRVVQRAAKSLSVPYVDTEQAFNAMLRKGSYPDYFVADGHCTARGYRVMAEAVVRELEGRGLISPKKRDALPGAARYTPGP